MSDPLQLRRYPMTFEKGVLQSLEDSVIPNGYAPRIENWAPTAAGGLRVRRGWSNGGTGGPATPNGVGVGYQADYQKAVAVHHDGASYQIYRTASSAPGGVLSTVGAAIAATPGYNVAMAMGQRTLIFGSPSLAKFYGVDNTGTRVDSGTNAVPQNIQALAYHHNAFYAGGGKNSSGTSIPYRLFFTDPGDGAIAAWPANNYIDVGYAAGGTINALETFRDDLLIGKQDSLWVLSGTPDDALDLHRLDAGSAAPGHSICSTPYGAVIAGYDGVYLYDGSTVQRISRPITTDYLVGFGATASGDVAYFDGKAYIVTSGTTLAVFVFDFDTGAWSTMVLPEGVLRLASFIGGAGKSYLVAATAGGTSARLLLNQVQYPENYSDLSGWTETFTLRTPEYWLGGPVRRATVRYLDLQLRQRGTGGTGLVFTPTVDGVAGTGAAIKTVAPNGAAGSFRTRLDFTKNGLTGFSCQFLVTSSPTSAQATFDIEQAVILYDLEGARA